MVQADPEKAQPSGSSELPFPVALQRQPAHCKWYGHEHSRPSTTLDTYGQVSSKMLQERQEM